MANYIYKNKIIRNADLRNRKYDEISVEFCSVLGSGLSGSIVAYSGKFIGNGWMDCSFFGSSARDLVLYLDRYERCNLGGAHLETVEFRETRAVECGFQGGHWTCARMEDCLFRKCNFKNVRIMDWDVRATIFRECVFDGISLAQAKLSGVTFQKCVFQGEIRRIPEGCVLQNCLIDC